MVDQDISKQFDKLRNNFRKELRESVNDIRLDALYQQLLMQHVFDRPEPLAAMTSWSIAPEFAWWLYQHVITERPEKIIELGSGTSTLVIAAALKRIGAGRFLSFEHDHAYLEKTRTLLEACDLQDYVELLYAPLERLDLDSESYRWYDLPYDLIDHMIGRKQLDLLIVDGPPAATNHHARYPAMVRLQEYCSDATFVLLDDAAREEEQEILGRWTAFLGGNYSHHMLDNVRHGPALFYPENKSTSLGVNEEAALIPARPAILQEVERLLESDRCNPPPDKDGELGRLLTDAFYRFREHSLNEVKLKGAVASEQRQKLSEELDAVVRERSEFEADLAAELEALKVELANLAEQHKLVYKSLVYQLGVAVYRQTRSITGWVKIPLAIRRVVRRHAGSRNPAVVEYQQLVSPRLKGSAKARGGNGRSLVSASELKTYSPELQRLVKGMDPQNVLWVALQIADEKGFLAALEFAETHACDIQWLALNLLRANASLDSETEWLRYLNSYLKPFELTQVSLKAGPGTRFSRLSVAGVLPSVDGPLISVIMPAFNAEAILKKAAESILAQTWRQLELIVVDDCSEDGTLQIAHELARADSRVKVIHNCANVGPYVSKNLALRIAQGSYITGHDADDWAHPERIEKQVQFAQEGGHLASLSRMLRLDNNGTLTSVSKCSDISPDGCRRTAFISCLFESDFLRKVLGGWDTVKFGADSEIIKRSERALGHSLPVLDAVTMLCLDVESGLTRHPEFGLRAGPNGGLSSVRASYVKAWNNWHDSLGGNFNMPFPHRGEMYSVPNEMQVPQDALAKVI